MQTRAIRQNNGKTPGGCGPDCPCDMGICYMFGDPHFYTFDGAATVLNHRTSSHVAAAPMNFWIIYSKSVLIQGIAGHAGKLAGLAISGEFVKNHTVILSNGEMTVDGTSILPQAGDFVGPDGLFEIYRHSQLMFPTKELLKEVDGTGAWYSAMRKHWRKFGSGGMNYHIKLPYGQAIYISGKHNFLQVVVKARPQAYQGGYCGNYNGHMEDDVTAPGSFWLGAGFPAGTRLGPIAEGEDMFKAAGISLSSSMLQNDVNHSQPPSCPEELMTQAKKACESIPEKMIRDSCIMDICFTNDTSYADEAMSMELMNVEFSKGSVEYQGKGTCLDSSGARYSTVKAKGISEQTECAKLLHELSHHEGMVSKGVRGAQFTEKGGEEASCDVLIDATKTDDVDLFEDIPFILTPGKVNSGKGIVSQTDNAEGVICWKIMI